MNCIKTLSLIACLTIGATTVIAQTKKIKVADTNLSHTYSIYHVLNENPAVKGGDYIFDMNGFIAIEGLYKNNQRAGTWTYYSKDGQPENVVDYNKGTVKYTKRNEIKHEDRRFEAVLQPTGDREAICLTSRMFKIQCMAKLIRYPDTARENGVSGEVIINIIIDSAGKIIRYTNGNHADRYLYDDAVRVMKLIPIEFLPAYKNGQPVESLYQQFVSFALQ